jgi:hypothetical protein
MLTRLYRWWYPEELSRVEVIKRLYAMPVIRPVKPHRNLILIRGSRDVFKRKVA